MVNIKFTNDKDYIYSTLGTFARKIFRVILVSVTSYQRNLSSNAIAVLPDRVFATLTNLDIL